MMTLLSELRATSWLLLVHYVIIGLIVVDDTLLTALTTELTTSSQLEHLSTLLKFWLVSSAHLAEDLSEERSDLGRSEAVMILLGCGLLWLTRTCSNKVHKMRFNPYLRCLAL